MNNKRIDFIWLGISVACYFVFSASFLIMPFESAVSEDGFSVLSHISGLIFWIFLLMGIISQCVLAIRRNKRNSASRVRRTKNSQKPGVFTFFKNPLATGFDIGAVVSFAGLIVSMIVTRGIGYICYVFLAILIFSFIMHCILNGRIYNELKYGEKN